MLQDYFQALTLREFGALVLTAVYIKPDNRGNVPFRSPTDKKSSDKQPEHPEKSTKMGPKSYIDFISEKTINKAIG